MKRHTIVWIASIVSIIAGFFTLSIGCSSTTTSTRAGTMKQSTVAEAFPGRVRWTTDYDNAFETMEEDTSLFVYIAHGQGNTAGGNSPTQQSNPVHSQSEMLSHPLIVEVIESYFIPVFIPYDLAVENSLISADLDNENETGFVLILKDGVKTGPFPEETWTKDLPGILIESIARQGKPVPGYLEIVDGDLGNGGTRESAVITLHCFWSGEVELGGEQGILYTQPGYIGDREALFLEFDSVSISYRDILKKSFATGLIDKAFPMNQEQKEDAKDVLPEDRIGDLSSRTFVPASRQADYKRYLGKSAYKYVPMTEKQKMMVNNALFLRKDPRQFLSPRQLQMYRYIKRKTSIGWKNRVNDTDFLEAWVETTSRILETSRGRVQIH